MAAVRPVVSELAQGGLAPRQRPRTGAPLNFPRAVAIDHQHAGEHLRRLLAGADPAEFAGRLLPRPPGDGAPLPPRVPGGSLVDTSAVERRWAALGRAPDPALWNNAEAAAADGVRAPH